MKAFELIKKLEQFDQDDEVLILEINTKKGRFNEMVDYEIINVENAGRCGRVIDLVVAELP